jgi:hypothetical protein
MSTDTFETPRLADSRPLSQHDDDTATTREQDAQPPRRPPAWSGLAAAVSQKASRAGEATKAGLATTSPALGRLRTRIRELVAAGWTAVGAGSDSLRRRLDQSRWRSLDAAIVVIWSIAVAMVSVELALAVSPLAGIAVALALGVGLGAGGQRLARLVTR